MNPKEDALNRIRAEAKGTDYRFFRLNLKAKKGNPNSARSKQIKEANERSAKNSLKYNK